MCAQLCLTLASSWAIICQALLYDISYMWNLKNTPTSEYNIKEADSKKKNWGELLNCFLNKHFSHL